MIKKAKKTDIKSMSICPKNKKIKQAKDNEKLGDCVLRIASEMTPLKQGGSMSNMEIIARQIVNGSLKGDHKMLSLFCDLMKTQQLTIEQYNFEIPQFIYNIKIDD